MKHLILTHLEVKLCEDAGALASDQGAAGVAVILGGGRGPGQGGSKVPEADDCQH